MANPVTFVAETPNVGVDVGAHGHNMGNWTATVLQRTNEYISAKATSQQADAAALLAKQNLDAAVEGMLNEVAGLEIDVP